jgi:hypothetical protein
MKWMFWRAVQFFTDYIYHPWALIVLVPLVWVGYNSVNLTATTLVVCFHGVMFITKYSKWFDDIAVHNYLIDQIMVAVISITRGFLIGVILQYFL